MTPFRFGPAGRQLYGVHHPAAPGPAPRSAVLLCNPFGQEAVRTHRMYRVLAERLARSGVHVLRFDYLGTGESSGDDGDGHLALWQDDLIAAHRELHRRSMRAKVTWVGARLGATLAALAASREPALAERLLLWEPVLDGAAYLDTLVHDHARALARSYSLVPDAFQRPPVHELMGFEVSPLLLAQLRALNATAVAPLQARAVTLVAPPDHADTQALALAYREAGVRPDVVPFTHAFDWTSEEAINTALVPHEAVQLIADTVTASIAPPAPAGAPAVPGRALPSAASASIAPSAPAARP